MNFIDLVLIFHLTNHYALVFAMREWVEAQSDTCENNFSCKPTIVRQILTARKGQKPKAWINFEEVREILLRWSGYRIIAVEKKVA